MFDMVVVGALVALFAAIIFIGVDLSKVVELLREIRDRLDREN
jgi:hypothetical protein